MDPRKSRSMRIKRAAEPQSGEWGSYDNNNNPPAGPWSPSAGSYGQSGTWNPSGGSYSQSGGTWNGVSSTPPQTNKPSDNYNRPQPRPQSGGIGGDWKGPTGPPPSPLKCCVRMYQDDDCKDKDTEKCVEDKNDRRHEKGKAPKDQKSFNIICT